MKKVKKLGRYKQQSRTAKISWFIVALAVTVSLAPHAAITRWLVQTWDPYFLSMVRSCTAAVICLPILIKYRKNLKGVGLAYGLFASVMMAVGVLCFIVSLSLQDASLVSLITLFTPLVLVYYSARVNHERISKQAKLGIAIAVAGAVIMLGNNFASIGHGGGFSLIAVLLGLVNCLAYPMATVYYKKANDQGVHLIALITLGLMISAGLNVVFWLLNGAHTEHSLSLPVLGALLYVIFIVAIIGKFLNIRSYEHVGSGVMGSLYYLQSTLAVLIPLVVLNEKISTLTLVGGAIILGGVWVAQYHKLIHSKHHRIFHIT